MSLQEYKRKRDFKKTAEPAGKKASGSQFRFVIQKHDASRLHYDFRLELGGTLKSWAVPKGIPYAKGEKRLAVQVEDHPIAYIDFEGSIPKGQYGGGTVMVWDFGTFEPLSKSPARESAGGKLHFILHGRKLEGEWYLVRLREGDQWLLIRGGADLRPISKKSDDTSALSGKTMKQLAADDRIWQSKAGNSTSAKSTDTPTKFPKFLEPMKARLVLKPPAGEWLYEIKFDGWRALALKGGSQTRLVSRNERDLGAKFPEIMEALSELKVQDAILDGEIVALDDKGRSSFQLLQACDLRESRPPIFFYAFDLLEHDGQSLRSLAISERKARLEKLLGKTSGIIRYSAALGNQAPPLLEQARKIGLEGLIGKRMGSLYEVGQRSGAWIKIKLLQEQEFVIGGYSEPEGTRPYFGSLIVGYYKGRKLYCAGKVGTGFNHKLLASLQKQFHKIPRDNCPFVNLPEKSGSRWGKGLTASEMKRCHWVEPSMVCQVKFSEWTKGDHLRQPVFLGLRIDKDASEVSQEKAN